MKLRRERHENLRRDTTECKIFQQVPLLSAVEPAPRKRRLWLQADAPSAMAQNGGVVAAVASFTSPFFTGQGASQRHETRLNQNGVAWLGLAWLDSK